MKKVPQDNNLALCSLAYSWSSTELYQGTYIAYFIRKVPRVTNIFVSALAKGAAGGYGGFLEFHRISRNLLCKESAPETRRTEWRSHEIFETP